MHRLSRTRLVSLVCPYAPFLAPRLLRVIVPVVAKPLQCTSSASDAQRSSYATESIRKGTSRSASLLCRRVECDRKTDNPASALLAQFRQACEIQNVQHLMDLYPTLLKARVLDSYDSRRITQTLHVRIRNASADSKRSDIFPFVERITADIRRGALKPNHYAFVHLFGIYKDCQRFNEGYELWQWLVQQDERYVSQAAYGAAIELMAYGGIMKLPDLENLYADGLKRFPGTFAEYHLSPDAIVPDRAQPTAIAGIPTILLQGILTARILARDWKKAYLALDTVLRLYPTQTPPRYFELFMTERPLAEAYSAYLLACRAGIKLKPTHVTVLLTKMRAAIGASPSMADRMMLVRAIANALYAYLEAGEDLHSIHVGAFIHSLEQILPDKIPGEDFEGVAAELRNLIAVAAHEIIAGLIQAGMSPQIHMFEALISLSGKLRVPGLLTTALQDVKTAGIDLGAIGIRSAITSAGLLRNKDLIEQLWQRVVSAAEAESAQIPFPDWITFTKACRRAGHADYFRSQLRKLPHAITSNIEAHLIQQVDQQEPVPSNHASFDYLIPGDLSSQIWMLKTQMKRIEAVVMSGQPLYLSKSPFYMNLDPDTPSLGPIDHLRGVYDGMTTDPHQPPPAPSAEGVPLEPTLSPTGIPLDELRFQNWVTVLEMMDAAEVYESDLQLALNTAINEGKPLKGRPEVLRLRRDNRPPLRTAREVRLKIEGLRTSSPTDVSLYRKIRSEVPSEKYKAMTYHASEDKWSTRKMHKHPTSKQPRFIQRERLAKREQQREEVSPKLTYYIGLESHHEAPWKPKKPLDFSRSNQPVKSSLEQPTWSEEKSATETPTSI